MQRAPPSPRWRAERCARSTRQIVMRFRLLPPDTAPETKLLLWGRGLRAFGDGFVSLLLPVYLTALGFGDVAVGAIATATLLGSAALSIVVGFRAHRAPRRR